MSRDKTRRKRFPFGKVAFLCLLVPAAYVLFQLYHVTRDTYEYETAISYTMADSIEADGVVLVDETPVEGSGNLGYLVSDGERVSAGTQVAEVYTDSSQAGVRAQLNTLNSQIALLEKSQNTSSAQVDVLISQRSTSIYDLLENIDRKNLDSMPDTREQYLLAQNKLQVTTGETANFSDRIGRLTEQRDALAQQLAALQSVTAPINGYFVSSTSAQRLNMAPADILALDAGDLKTLLQNGAVSSMDGEAGKIVPSYTWQFCGVCTTEEADKFQTQKNAKVQISFPGKSETQLPAAVISVEKDEATGLAKFVLQCEYINADVLKLSQATAQIDFTEYSGLRISAAAIHYVRLDQLSAADGAAAVAESSSVDASTSDNGEALAESLPAAESTASQQNGDYVEGVYVKYGNLACFRRIRKIYEDPKGEYVLIDADGKVGTDNEVRLYDEIVVSGTKLYDGKIL